MRALKKTGSGLNISWFEIYWSQVLKFKFREPAWTKCFMLIIFYKSNVSTLELILRLSSSLNIGTFVWMRPHVLLSDCLCLLPVWLIVSVVAVDTILAILRLKTPQQTHKPKHTQNILDSFMWTSSIRFSVVCTLPNSTVVYIETMYTFFSNIECKLHQSLRKSMKTWAYCPHWWLQHFPCGPWSPQVTTRIIL